MAEALTARVAFITGAAHGQGRATALAFARAGVRVAALDVAKPLAYPAYGMGTSAELGALQAEVRGLGVDCLTFAADVRDDRAVGAAVGETAASTCCSTTRASARTAWRTS